MFVLKLLSAILTLSVFTALFQLLSCFPSCLFMLLSTSKSFPHLPYYLPLGLFFPASCVFCQLMTTCHTSCLTKVLAWFLFLRLPIQLENVFVQIWTSIRACLNELCYHFFWCHLLSIAITFPMNYSIGVFGKTSFWKWRNVKYLIIWLMVSLVLILVMRT